MRSAPLLTLIFGALLTALPSTAQAQMSPNCERNGRRDFCALTPMPDPSQPGRTVDVLVFADHSVYRVQREEASCRSTSPTVTTCAATITLPGGGRTIRATYRGTSYEGGYRHDYRGPGLQLTYAFLD